MCPSSGAWWWGSPITTAMTANSPYLVPDERIGQLCPPPPLDPDVEASPRFLPPWPHVALVGLGGAAGTAVRVLLAAGIPTPAGFPLGILIINVVGAFLLGALTQTLASRGSDEGRRRLARLTLGTGLIGGFTTYSTVTLDLAHLSASSPAIAAAYFAATVIGGVFASFAGIVAGRHLGRISR